MTEYLITARVRTGCEPRDDIPWPDLNTAITKAVFKARPKGEVLVLGMKVEQVEPMVSGKE